MCGGCNVLAEGAGASLIVARYWWVARQGRKAVVEAESVAGAAVDAPPRHEDRQEAFVDPLPELSRVT